MKRLIIGALLLWAVTPQARADIFSAIDSYRAGDHESALAEFRALAEMKDPLAQHALGLMYAEGAGVPHDRIAAAKWFRLAGVQGFAQSQYNLAVSYYTGIGVPQSYAEAAAWYRKAAEQGDVRAQNNLGYIYDTGKGIEKNHEIAVYWYQQAAAAGNKNAQVNLANSYRLGRGVPKDEAKALEWYAMVFDDLETVDPLSLWTLDRVGRTSRFVPVEGPKFAVPRLEAKYGDTKLGYKDRDALRLTRLRQAQIRRLTFIHR